MLKIYVVTIYFAFFLILSTMNSLSVSRSYMPVLRLLDPTLPPHSSVSSSYPEK